VETLDNVRGRHEKGKGHYEMEAEQLGGCGGIIEERGIRRSCEGGKIRLWGGRGPPES